MATVETPQSILILDSYPIIDIAPALIPETRSLLDKLPNELYFEILEHISEPPDSKEDFHSRTKDVKAFTLVCRATRETGQESLHYHICFSTLASLSHWLRSETHYAARSIRFGRKAAADDDTDLERINRPHKLLLLEVINKSPRVERLIIEMSQDQDITYLDMGVFNLPRLKYFRVRDADLSFSRSSSAEKLASLRTIEYYQNDGGFYSSNPGVNMLFISSPGLRTFHTNGQPRLALISTTLTELTLDSRSLFFVPLSINQFIHLRRLSVEVDTSRELLEFVSALSCKLDYLCVVWLGGALAHLLSTEGEMLTCLKMKSMKELKHLKLGRGFDNVFPSSSMHAFGNECARREIEVVLDFGTEAIRMRYTSLDNPLYDSINSIPEAPERFLITMVLSILLGLISCVIGYLVLS